MSFFDLSNQLILLFFSLERKQNLMLYLEQKHVGALKIYRNSSFCAYQMLGYHFWMIVEIIVWVLVRDFAFFYCS
jgi:hypothetical protein